MSGLLFDSIAAHARFAEGVRVRREAVLIARSLLDQACAPGARDAFPDAGRAGAFAWRVWRRREAAEARDTRIPVEEVRIEVRDAGSGRRLASVATLRIAR